MCSWLGVPVSTPPLSKLSYIEPKYTRSRRSMDRTPPSEGGDTGSTPVESTILALRSYFLPLEAPALEQFPKGEVLEWIFFVLVFTLISKGFALSLEGHFVKNWQLPPHPSHECAPPHFLYQLALNTLFI